MNVTTLKTLAIGGLGALLALLIGVPAGAILGAAIATSVAAWTRTTLRVPDPLRDAAFLVIGIALGSGIEAGFLDDLQEWALSLGLLTVSVGATILLSSQLLMRFWRQDKDTAFLASTPGTLSMVIAIAADGRGDASTVLVMQTMRLLALTALVPLAVSLLGIADPGAATGPVAHVSLPVFLAMALPGAVVSLGLNRAGFPAAFLLGGMIVSAVAHGAGLAQGQPPAWIVTAGFAVTGTAVGSRFSGIGLSQIRKALGATGASVGAAAALSACFAAIASSVTGLPLAQVWVAFAPGGLEAMTAIGLALNVDPAYVATHHLFRILLLIGLLSVVMRRAR